MNLFARHLAVGIALVLLAAQTASLSHQHADDALPAGQQSAVCDLCTGLHASAPAPEAAAVAHHAGAVILLPAAVLRLALPSRPSGAHRSRAPPLLRFT